MGVLFRACVVVLLCLPGAIWPQAGETQLQLPLIGNGPAVPPFHADEGLMKLDIAVTGKNGAPVAGLTAEDFTLLDNGAAQKPVTFAAFDDVKSFSDPPAQVIFVLDALNSYSEQLNAAEKAIKRFLLRNDGHLDEPAAIYRLSSGGLYASDRATMNGPDLVKEIDMKKEPREVRKALGSGIPLGMACSSAEARNQFSLEAFGAMVMEQRRTPGRKVVIWMGPGWPAAGSCALQNSFDWITEFSTRMREARIALYVDGWTSPEKGFVYGQYTGAVTRNTALPRYLALPVLAANSGGEVLENSGVETMDGVMVAASGDLETAIERIAGYARVFYTITFNPPRAGSVDEYHTLKVNVDGPAATGLKTAPAVAHTWTGYYGEPSLYDQAPKLEGVSVAQLESRLEALSQMRDGEAADQISSLQLTERLSWTRAAAWAPRLRGEKAREALVALADESAFLALPAADTPQKPAPAIDEQREMMARTVKYLTRTIPKLPDFYAARVIAHYEERRPRDETWKTLTGDASLHESRVESQTVHYRNGKETVDEPVREARDGGKNKAILEAEGTFGAILSTVIPDAAQSELEWDRWEQTARGLRAVFRFAVPNKKSHYHASYCCVTDMNESARIKWLTGYHGELMIDPESGEILRLVLQADLDPALPLDRADLMVTYGPTQVGSGTYICPRHSVAITRGRTRMEVNEWGGTLQTFGPYRTMLNDMTYSHYHKFGTTMRILPGFTPGVD